MKNSNDTIWNRTSDLPICSKTPEPLCYRGLTAIYIYIYIYIYIIQQLPLPYAYILSGLRRKVPNKFGCPLLGPQ